MSAKGKKGIPSSGSNSALSIIGNGTAAQSPRPSSTSTRGQAQTFPSIGTKKTVGEDTTEELIVEAYFKQIESLPLPFSLLKEGLSEIGDSPDKLRPVFRKLSLPVSTEILLSIHILIIHYHG